jgi:hypothetical protein
MQTDITRYAWKRRGCSHCTRKLIRKRERRPLGFISPGAARLRRCMKRQRHRHARRTVRASLRGYAAAHSDH